MCCETPVSVGHVFARSMLGLRCPWTTLRLALKGSGGPDRRYGVLRERNAKTLLVDVFLYLTVVCWTSKKSLFSWRIPRAEFLIHFQDPSRAGERARAGVVGNTGSLGRLYSAETAETAAGP